MARWGRGTVLVVSLAACGGKAVVDGAGAGGNHTSSTSSTSGPTTTTGSISVGVPVNPACVQACDAIAACANVRDCLPACLAITPSCAGPHTEWLEWLFQEFDSQTCTIAPADFNGPLDVYLGCEGTCVVERCSIDPGGNCNCNLGCQDVYESRCTTSGSAYVCDCLVNGNPIGSCISPSTDAKFVCSVRTGCCGPYFFIDGP